MIAAVVVVVHEAGYGHLQITRDFIRDLVHLALEFRGPGIEYARLDPLPPAKVSDGNLPSETLENDADLVIWRVLPAGLGPDLPDESLGLLC